MLASSSVFWMRWIWQVRSRTSCFLVRIRLRSSTTSCGGTKLAPDQPVRLQIREPNRVRHVALAARNGLDVLGIGQNQLEVPGLDRMCHTGFQ